MKNQDADALEGAGPHGFEEPPDRLMERVCDALRANGFVDASEVDVDVRPESEEVVLKGRVPTSKQKKLAEDCVISLQGVSTVQNRLKVHS